MISSLKTSLAAAAFATVATPMLADEVNVYSYRQPELVEPLFAAFTAETGIKVNTVFLNKGMAERLKAEGSRSPADLAFTTDIGRLSALQDADVLQPYTSDTLEANVPAQFRDPDGLWTGLTTRARAVYASKDRVSEEAITYEDLASDTWKGRICTRSGLHAYQVALTAAVIEKYDEATAKTWLEGLKSNLARKPQGNDRAQVKAVSEGVCDIAIGNTYYMALMLKDAEQKAWADAVRIIFPTFEDGGTHVNISGVALTKAAPNRDNAIKLIEFLTSPEGQSLYAQVNDEYPVSPGITSPSVISSFGSFDADDASLQDIVAARPAAIRITEEVDYDG